MSNHSLHQVHMWLHTAGMEGMCSPETLVSNRKWQGHSDRRSGTTSAVQCSDGGQLAHCCVMDLHLCFTVHDVLADPQSYEYKGESPTIFKISNIARL